MDGNWRELKGLSVLVNEVLYVPTMEAPEDKPHPFVYFISIVNDSKHEIVIHGRKWVVRESNGEMLVLEGDGVIGQHPNIPPGDSFSYNSYHVLASDGEAWGAFYGLTSDGQRIMISIPPFAMEVPQWG